MVSPSVAMGVGEVNHRLPTAWQNSKLPLYMLRILTRSLVWASLFSFPTNSNYTCKQNGYPEATFSKIKLATDPGEYEDVALIDLKQHK